MLLSGLVRRALPRFSWPKTLFAVSVISAFTLLLGCGAGAIFHAVDPVGGEAELHLRGNIHGGQQPVSGATIQLYAAGTSGDQSAATALIDAPAVLSDSNGGFNITNRYACPSPEAQVYLVAKGGNPGIASGVNNNNLVMMTALGRCGGLSSSSYIYVNEVTTVGSVYALAPFMASFDHIGSTTDNASVLADDFALVNEVVNTATGIAPGPVAPPDFTVPVPKLYTLADVVAACVNSPGGASAGDGSPCGALFQAATPAGGTAPANTVDALLNIANNPTNNVRQIYNMGPPTAPFQPTLVTAPADWIIIPEPTITVAGAAYPVGINSTATGTVTLGRTSKNDLSIALTSASPSYITVNSPVTISAGQTVANFTYSGAAVGNSLITAVAGGYSKGAAYLTATDQLLSLGAVPTLTPGQSADLPLSLGQAAPAGGLTVTLTSSDPSIATVTPSTVTIPAGARLPVSSPQVTGSGLGVARITAQTSGYAQGTSSVRVALTATLPGNTSLPVGTTNLSLVLSGPTPAGGLTFALASSDTSVATVPASVTVLQGTTSVSVPVTAIRDGTATIRGTAAGVNDVSGNVSVITSINTSDTIAGRLTQASASFALGVSPTSPVTVTLTSNNPALFTISSSATTTGSTSLTVQNVSNTNGVRYYVQGQSVGNGTITISAPGYAVKTAKVSVYPTGFWFGTNDITTTTLSKPTSVAVYLEVLSPVNGAPLGEAALNPDAASISIPLSRSDPTVGTLDSLVLTAGKSFVTGYFQPVGTGTTTLSITQPNGFSAPSSGTSIQASVTAPSIYGSNEVAGKFSQTHSSVSLSQAPNSPVAVTLTSSNPALFTLSPDIGTVGTSSITFPGVGTTGNVSYWIQGQAIGSGTITVSAPGYTSKVLQVSIFPTGFVLGDSSFTTSTLSGKKNVSVYAYMLVPGTNAMADVATLNPGLGPLTVTLTSSDAGVGTISSPVSFTAGSSYQVASFQPVGVGTTNLSITQPAGFTETTTPYRKQITATVTAPEISAGDQVTGVHVETSANFGLAQTPPSPVTVTVTSNSPALFLVSKSADTVGSASVTYSNVSGTSGFTYYVQGLAQGTGTLTVSAPGFAPKTVTINVYPTGFLLSSNDISTTTFSAPTSIQVNLDILSPGSFNIVGPAVLSPGLASITVPLSSSAPSVGTISGSVTFNSGNSYAVATFQPVAAGSTTISLTQPAGYSTPSYYTQFTATVSAPTLYASDTQTGVNLQVAVTAGLNQAPPAPVTVTLTSSNASVFAISTSATTAGGESVTFTGVAGTAPLHYFVQGLSVGTATLKIAATGYTTRTVNIVVSPSGAFISNGDIAANAGGYGHPVGVSFAYLSAATLQPLGTALLNPGLGNVSVSLTSSSPTVGTISGPAVLNDTKDTDVQYFTPLAAGTSVISVTQPSGFTAPSSRTQVTATVQ